MKYRVLLIIQQQSISAADNTTVTEMRMNGHHNIIHNSLHTYAFNALQIKPSLMLTLTSILCSHDFMTPSELIGNVHIFIVALYYLLVNIKIFI